MGKRYKRHERMKLMKIVVLTGSPHVQGTTSVLADEFVAGAQEAGHEVVRFDTAQMQIHPCTGCDHCKKVEETCIFKDDMLQVYPKMKEAEAVVFVSPLYYFGVTAQLKSTIDRFYAINLKLRENPTKAYLLAAGADVDDWAMDGLTAHMKTMCRYLNWEFKEGVLALGAGVPEDLENTDYPRQARELGLNVAG